MVVKLPPNRRPFVLSNATRALNPYVTAFSLLRRRLVWDLNPHSWISRSKLKEIHDSHNGNKAIIICNGPSLLKSDLNLISQANIFTFGLNKINLLFPKTHLRPSAIVAVNPFVITQNCEFFNTTNIPLFLDSCAVKLVKSRSEVVFLHSMYQIGFAEDCSVSISQGATVTFVAMQLAFHMGFREVALIGCDHSFKAKGSPNTVAIKEGVDEDHFDPHYFADGVSWHLPDLGTSESAYCLARSTYEGHGRRLVNATEGGKLELLPRIRLEDFLSTTEL